MKTALIILDGWGHGNPDKDNAIHVAHTPFVDALNESTPCASVRTGGEHARPPVGHMGNSAEAHMNIGAGRIGNPDRLRIARAASSGAAGRQQVVPEA